MTPLTYARADDAAAAVRLGSEQGAKYLGGGTNLVDLLRESIEHPHRLIDVTGLSSAIEEREDGSLLIGAAARNTALASHRAIRSRYPVLSRAVVAGASAQIRNMATVGGNVLQRTRCTYFYDDQGSRCNKRNPGQGCDAIGGFNHIHAILGASSACIATHPSDMCVALAALGAIVHLRSVSGERTVPVTDLHCLPGDQPHIETVLAPGELITAVELPALPLAARSTYRKVRDRSSYAFGLVSVAAAIETEGDTVKEVRLALGGVAPKPWRAWKAEATLKGKAATADEFLAAARAELADAVPQRDNAFKVTAERLGLPMDRVSFCYGDSSFPGVVLAGGSQQTASIGAAVVAAHRELVTALLKLVGKESPLIGLKPDEVIGHHAGLCKFDEPKRCERYAAILERAGRDELVVEAAAPPPLETQHWSMHSHGAMFCEARVNVITGEPRISRFLGSFDCGRIMNAKTASSQLRGGIVMGLGLALMEEAQFDERQGRVMNPSLAEYHVPVHMDVPNIDVMWTDIPDPHSPMGAHGVGEIGITGVGAAVANAIYNACGKRVRDLPITLDKLL